MSCLCLRRFCCYLCCVRLKTSCLVLGTYLSKAYIDMRFVVSALCVVAIIAIAAQALTATRSPSKLQLVVHLARVHSEEEIENEFVSRSTPGTPNFRQFLSQSELTELVQGKRDAIEAVTYFLSKRGASNIHLVSTRDFITCVVSNEVAAALGYHQGSLGRFSLTVPYELTGHARYFILNAAKGTKARPAHVGEPGAEQTPITINARYKVPASIPTPPGSYSQGVAEFEGEYFRQSDMNAFIAKYNQGNISIAVMGPNTANPNADSIEGTLDLQYQTSVSGGKIKTWWLAQSGDNNDPGNIDFSAWAESVLNLSPMPYVVSISWGMGYERYDFAESVLFSDNDAFRKMGLRGVSVFAASGDSGPGVRSEILNCQSFTPSWPASSPYLTSVGATYAAAGTASLETAVDWSGGGFSTVFGRPAYQDAAVRNYFSTAANMPNASFYNASGRGYPDVSALGTNYNVFVGNSWQEVSGTSCASPTFSGIVSLIVAERIAAGNTSLGFINPALYQLGKVGYDVVAGQSQDTNCIPFFPIKGFPASTGWDAVSGLGTPDYEYLRQSL